MLFYACHCVYGGLLFLIANFVSCIGILLKKHWARWLFLISVIVPSLLVFNFGYGVLGPYTAVLQSVILIISGVVIGILFFTKEESFHNENIS